MEKVSPLFQRLLRMLLISRRYTTVLVAPLGSDRVRFSKRIGEFIFRQLPRSSGAGVAQGSPTLLYLG